jgi:hypothetical protein
MEGNGCSIFKLTIPTFFRQTEETHEKRSIRIAGLSAEVRTKNFIELISVKLKITFMANLLQAMGKTMIEMVP